MAFRRVLISGERVENTKDNLDSFFAHENFKTKLILSPIKKDTIVVDINGDGADTVAKKVKDIGLKYKMKSVIKLEKPMSAVGESKIKKSALKEIIKEEIRNILK